MEELYTRTFDLQAVCSPYVGYQLFGDSYKRGIFMARLNEGTASEASRQAASCRPHRRRPPFPGCGAEDEFSRALLAEGLVPALAKMRQSWQPKRQSLLRGLGALSLALGEPDKTGWTMRDAVLFIVFPYVAVALAVGGSLYRFFAHQFTYSSLSSQWLEGRWLFWGALPWHYGIVPVLLIHLGGFAIPRVMAILHGTPTTLYLQS